MSILKTSLLSITIIAASLSSAFAGSCGYDKCWGAVAIGQNGQAWSQHYASERAAIDSIRNNCSGPCQTIKTFYNTCGAIASAPNGAWGWAWHGSMEIAKSEAMAYCMDNGRDCTPRAWACSK